MLVAALGRGTALWNVSEIKKKFTVWKCLHKKKMLIFVYNTYNNSIRNITHSLFRLLVLTLTKHKWINVNILTSLCTYYRRTGLCRAVYMVVFICIWMEVSRYLFYIKIIWNMLNIKNHAPLYVSNIFVIILF